MLTTLLPTTKLLTRPFTACCPPRLMLLTLAAVWVGVAVICTSSTAFSTMAV